NSPITRSVSMFPAAPGTGKQSAEILVQDNLVAGPDATKLLADGHVVALVALSGLNTDPERPRSGNWMNNTRAWLVGRNLPATHAAEINAAVAEMGRGRGWGPSRDTCETHGGARLRSA